MAGQESRGDGALRLRLLGGFELRAGDRLVIDRSWPRSKAKALLKLVAIEGQVHRDRVLDLLWPELDVQAGAANLRKNLHHLRTALTAEGVWGTVLTVRDEVVQLERDVEVDAELFRALAETALASGEAGNVEAALAAYRGELLPEDLYEDWTAATRRELDTLRRRLLLEGADVDQREGRLDRAVTRLETVLHEDPFDEDIHRRLMRAHLHAGSRHRALRQFQDCANLLRSELGLEPSPQTVELHDAIVAGTSPASSVTEDRAPPITGVRRPALFGRESELEAALDVVDAALAGAGGVLVIGGPAGIGKSRLAIELLTAAGAAGALVARGRSFELEAAVAYQPVRDVLRQLVADPAVEATLRHTVYAKRLFADSTSPVTTVADPVLLESELIEEVVHVLTKLAAQRPLALLVEDIHAADPATIRLLHVLGRRVANCAGLLVVTYRNDEVVAGSAADRLVVSLRRHAAAVEVELPALPDQVVRLVVRERFGPDPVEASLLDSVVTAAEGNPLFATELVDTLKKTGTARLEAARWVGDGGEHPTPAVVRDLVQTRLAALGDDARNLVAAASVLGRQFDYDRLRRCVGAMDDVLLGALDDAIAASVIEEDQAGYRFRHELVRSSIYERISGARRRHLHRAVAEALVGLGEEGAGYHLARSDEPWRAVPQLRDDARRAGAVFANDTARALYHQALELAREHADRAAATAVPELLEDIGDLATRTGDVRVGSACLAEALDRFSQLGEDEAVLRVRAKAALAHMVVGDVGAATGLLHSHLEAWEQVLVDAGGEEMAALAPSAAFHMLADIRWHSGRSREALEAAQRAVDEAESTGGILERAQAYESMALACHSLGDWRQGLEYELQRGTLGLPGFTDVALDAHY